MTSIIYSYRQALQHPAKRIKEQLHAKPTVKVACNRYRVLHIFLRDPDGVWTAVLLRETRLARVANGCVADGLRIGYWCIQRHRR